ncbi:MAG TPA: hypothetical protein VE709_07380 [Pseudonocardiaceae bacterium]|nr:hypothetical protein [Pseudonocardiaceae bacterium]
MGRRPAAHRAGGSAQFDPAYDGPPVPLGMDRVEVPLDGIEDYLLDAGVQQADLAKIRGRLLT